MTTLFLLLMSLPFNKYNENCHQDDLSQNREFVYFRRWLLENCIETKAPLKFRLVKKLFFARLFWHIETILLHEVSFSATQQFLFLPKNCYYQLKNTIFTRIFRPFLLRKRSYIIVD